MINRTLPLSFTFHRHNNMAYTFPVKIAWEIRDLFMSYIHLMIIITNQFSGNYNLVVRIAYTSTICDVIDFFSLTEKSKLIQRKPPNICLCLVCNKLVSIELRGWWCGAETSEMDCYLCVGQQFDILNYVSDIYFNWISVQSFLWCVFHWENSISVDVTICITTHNEYAANTFTLYCFRNCNIDFIV